MKTTRDLRRCTNFTQDFVLEKLNDAIARRLSESVHVLHEDYVGTLTRCLKHLEGNQDEDGSTPLASKALQDVRSTKKNIFSHEFQRFFPSRFYNRPIKSTFRSRRARICSEF